ncbi:cell division protein CrgA [Skermania piniformis]|uniref:Cell division protein CrgA n=1 Tax=Skermania pinensis TaxID=39122 RepID=A0ABX8SDQ7_9ACTN|nr:cell division protein CrgA [Skermania piniformis]QXQ15566.1 cell division protein CrgA [Skermania piniformis]
MPKSKVRKKTDYTINPASVTTGKKKVAGPSSPWYIGVMLAFMLAGLIWLIVYYLAGDQIGWMGDLNAWNFLIGFGLMVTGLLMTMGWR